MSAGLWSIGILTLLGLLFVALLFSPDTDEEPEHSMDWHRTHGTHRVRYPDGKFSQAFSYKVACDYQSLFGGEVIRR